jgi:trehalose/maltose hydrolase-like predicted phosphorylase
VTIPEILDRTFEGILLDWETIALDGRANGADAARARVEALCGYGVYVFVVSGKTAEDVDALLAARPSGPGRLYLCASHGAEVFRATTRGIELVMRRSWTPEETARLERAAARSLAALDAKGLAVHMAAAGPSRYTIDLVPEVDRADPRLTSRTEVLSVLDARLAKADIAGLDGVVDLVRRAARRAGHADIRITTDMRDVALSLTDKSDAARFAARVLRDQGVTGSLVLVVGNELGSLGGVRDTDAALQVDELARAIAVSVCDEPSGVASGVQLLGGGPPRLVEILDAQLKRRAARRVPSVDDDPRWTILLSRDPSKVRVSESLGALANGRVGVRGSAERTGPQASPLFAAAGLYDDRSRLVHGPIWTIANVAGDSSEPAASLVDLRTGVLVRLDTKSGMRSLRFISSERLHTMALRAEAPDDALMPGDVLHAPDRGGGHIRRRGGATVARSGSVVGTLAVAARERWAWASGRATLERICAWSTGRDGAPTERRAARQLARAGSAGFDALLAEQRRAWAQRWRGSEVTIVGGAEAARDELAARFSVFHLLAASCAGGEAAVGARGLTGDAYDGHVFWDADMFVLPALVALRPEAARSMLEYRIRRLPAARAQAAALGRRGARFPWESARDGTDVTPRLVHGPHGEPIPILTGAHEEHIVADVAWAAVRYAEWTGDAAFLEGPGRDLVVETARYWASRARLDRAGRAHLYGVMGPDEYHEVVDDNAYTNVMARWNLRRGADLLDQVEGVGIRSAADSAGTRAPEAAAWRDLAARLVDGFDADRGVYEQFAGYFGLEPLVVSDFARPPVAMDVLLGPERVRTSQLIKQADVLMIHHVLPTVPPRDSLERCLDFYEPRTAHGSSLSPAISAALLARAGRPDEALDLFRTAARIDLDDVTGTTAGGLHLAAMGGVWQALAFGFLGVRTDSDTVVVDPHLPSAWRELSMRFRVLGVLVEVRASHDDVVITSSAPLRFAVGGTEVEHRGGEPLVVPIPKPSRATVTAVKRSPS